MISVLDVSQYHSSHANKHKKRSSLESQIECTENEETLLIQHENLLNQHEGRVQLALNEQQAESFGRYY